MDYKIATTIEEIEQYLSGSKVVAFDFETSPLDEYREEPMAALDPHKAEITGVSFSVKENTAIYVPFGHKVGKNAELSSILSYLKSRLFKNPDIVKIAHNLAYEAMFLYKHGIVIQEPAYDTIVASQLTLKNHYEFRNLGDSGLKTLVPQLYNEELPKFLEVVGDRSFDELDSEDWDTIRYACADSDYTLRLYQTFNQWFDEYMPKHRELCENIESPTAIYAGLMKYNGVGVDVDSMLSKQVDADSKIAELKEEIQFIIGDVEIGSNCGTNAFKDYLYKSLGLPVLKTTAKYADAADDETMQRLTEYCKTNRPELVQLFELVQEYRKWAKIKSTYLDGYLKWKNSKTNRIHPDLMPMGTDTGRFASRKPNLQNCFDDQTEILTENGWQLFSELKHGEKVAEWNRGDISFVEPDEIIIQDYKGKMISAKNQHANLLMTPEHRCLFINRKNNRKVVVSAKDYAKDALLLHAGQYKFGDKKLTEAQLILIAATQADGSYSYGNIDFIFSKERKFYRLKYALELLGYKYTESWRDEKQRRIRLKDKAGVAFIKEYLGESKTYGKWLLELDRQSVKMFLDELYNWDGCFTRGSMYSSSIKENIDWVQIVYALTGTRAHLREYDNKNPNAKINYQLDIVNKDHSMTANTQISEQDYDGKVYCVSVPSSYIVVRRKGQVVISGNCPRKSNDPIGIRNCIVARDGYVFVDFDFSQIELRVGAYYCNDEKMMQTYLSGGDIHSQTQEVIFGTREKNKEMRTIAKNCNFGAMFGLFAKGLQRTLKFKGGVDKTVEECESIIRNLKSGYPRLAEWQRETIAQAKHDKYSETAFGRRRYLKGINSADWGIKSYNERCALNTPIQGTAADILKLAMVRLVKELANKDYIKPILQIHDELLFEVREDKLAEAITTIKTAMEVKPFEQFNLPIIAEGEQGYKFGELRAIE